MYDPHKLKENKDGILGMFLEDLKVLSEGKLPTAFSKKRRHLEAAIPYFPLEEQEGLKAMINTAFKQERYLQAKGIVDALEGYHSQREESIRTFLEKYL